MLQQISNKIFLGLSLLLLTTGVLAMDLTSSAFSDGDRLPTKYTCDGQGISPPLAWKNFPTNTKSFALISDDPDAPRGTWTHWILYNIPTTTTSLPENVTALPPGTKVGFNSWPQNNYGSPCPPSGTHRYFFKIFALDTLLDLKGKVTSEILQTAMQGHVLDQAEMVTTYSRKK